jgi:hypothetical protein
MAKVRCSGCAREENSFCTLKKVGVARRKKRNCDKFVLAPEKVKVRQAIPTMRLPYAKQQELKAEAKRKLKEVRELLKEGKTEEAEAILTGRPLASAKPVAPDSKHPLTGDLSRFTSTIKEDD